MEVYWKYIPLTSLEVYWVQKVVQKQITTDRGLNLAIKSRNQIYPWLIDSVPESGINAIPGTNGGLNLTHLVARLINSLIEGIKFANKTKWSTYCQIQGGKKCNSGYLVTFQ